MKIVFWVIKQNKPPARKRGEDTKGRQLKILFLFLFFAVALKKNAAARTIMQRERILTGSLNTTTKVNTSIG